MTRAASPLCTTDRFPTHTQTQECHQQTSPACADDANCTRHYFDLRQGHSRQTTNHDQYAGHSPPLTKTLGTPGLVPAATAESFLFALTLPTVLIARCVPTAVSATATWPRRLSSPVPLLAWLLRSSLPSLSRSLRRERWRRLTREEERSRLEHPDNRG